MFYARPETFKSACKNSVLGTLEYISAIFQLVVKYMWVPAELSRISFIETEFIRLPCLSILWFLRPQHVSMLCGDWWVFCVQGAAPRQNALLLETRGDRKPGPERAGWGRLQVS